MPRASSPPLDPCPFIDDDDPRCAGHLKLSHLDEAFGVCVDGFRACPTYWRLLRADPRRLIHVTNLTRDGRPLQPTGT